MTLSKPSPPQRNSSTQSVITLETLNALLTPIGLQLLTDAAAYTDPLQAITGLRKKYLPELVAAAVETVELRRRAAAKFKNADVMFFTREALEQASVGKIASHRAKRYANYERVADWGCGIGIDTLGLARVSHVIAMDTDPLRIAMAKVNLFALGRDENVDFVVGDYLVEPNRTDAIWADPARRVEGRRFTDPSQYDPPLGEIIEYAGGRPLGVKISPAVDASAIPPEAEVEFISMGGELKEAVLWFGELRTCMRRATVLPDGLTLVPTGELVQTVEPGRVLYDPDPAVVRAGAVADLGRMLGAWQIDPRIAYLSNDAPTSTPFAQTLMIDAVMPWNLKEVKRHLRTAGQHVEEVRKRGVAVDVDIIRKALRNPGHEPVALVLTRVQDEPTAIIARRWKG